MQEKDIENLIAQHPDEFFPNEDFKLVSQQYNIGGRRIDILFEDKHSRKVIVEVKRGILTREASGQIIEYYGLLKENYSDSPIELVLVANNIPPERRTFLENVGISCVQLSYSNLLHLAKKYNYPLPQETPFARVDLFQPKILYDSWIAAWIFQGNPNIYDVFNALSDINLEKIHWAVNQHAKDMRVDQIGLIWISGKDAGIYAVTRLLSDPQMMEEFPEEKKYWIDVGKERKTHLRVRMSILNRLLRRPIFRSTLLATKELENLSILKQPQGTNFPVSVSEWNIISGLIYGNSTSPNRQNHDAPKLNR